jgi:uncharacterized heparinase superfamily protein
MTGPLHFDLLGEQGGLEHGWDDPQRSALWTYNLHYFDDLRRAGWRGRKDWHRTLVSRWITENPPPIGVGWDAYPTSLRIVNWIAWDLAAGLLTEHARICLASQAEWLSRSLETHLLGNHLFANLKALVFAGSYFDGAVADRWMGIAVARLERELGEQVLNDGGNFELSPMYHSIFLADLIDLVNLSDVFPGRISNGLVERLRETAGRMLGWLAAMTHPDGEIAQFNDAALGVAPALAQLEGYAASVGIERSSVGKRLVGANVEALHLADTGYVRLETDHAVAICDVALVGPDYLPGHAHADTLSYELSVGSRRIVVNGGTSQYGLGPGRLRERSTVSHSTVEIAGLSSSEVWSGFRVGRRACPFDVTLEALDVGVRLAASHDGYKRLAGAPIHRRSWTMRQGELIVEDTVRGGGHVAVARHILHPAYAHAMAGGPEFATSPPYELTPARHAPRFGESIITQAIAVPLLNGAAEVRWSWR